MTEHVRRNLDLERAITRHAARGHVDAESMIRHAEARAERSRSYVHDHMMLAERDWLREIREELADARNYLVWLIMSDPEHDDIKSWFDALRCVLEAYERLRMD